MNVIGPLSGFLLICCAYSAQYWAYRCFKELKRMNEHLDKTPRE